ncbi:MAG TPA: hypothetical protein VK874_13995 [Gaiellaceae bacterium]|nr:hypothetical protein [Gaiellaceae bacterium]
MCWSRYEERWELREALRLEEEIRRLAEETDEHAPPKPAPERDEENERELVQV